jgi:N-dimethylarginine dimethylaminohydrolase
MQAEHDVMIAALRREGVQVESVEGAPTDPKAMYTRDNAVAVQGGAIIGRMGPVGARPGMGRRGEEAFVTRKLASLGMPILRTIHGSGLFEGGSFALLDERTAMIGLSYRQNEEAARQIEEVLAVQGVRLIRVPLAGHALHIDGQLVMVDHGLALINVDRTPYWVLDTLRELKIRWVEVHWADNPRVVNCLAVRPGKVLLAINNGDGTAERLVGQGVEVVPLDYAESQKNGGGIHCSTLPLVRDRD